MPEEVEELEVLEDDPDELEVPPGATTTVCVATPVPEEVELRELLGELLEEELLVELDPMAATVTV